MVIPLKPREEPAQICPGNGLIQQGGGGGGDKYMQKGASVLSGAD